MASPPSRITAGTPQLLPYGCATEKTQGDDSDWLNLSTETLADAGRRTSKPSMVAAFGSTQPSLDQEKTRTEVVCNLSVPIADCAGAPKRWHHVSANQHVKKQSFDVRPCRALPHARATKT